MFNLIYKGSLGLTGGPFLCGYSSNYSWHDFEACHEWLSTGSEESNIKVS